MVQEASDIETSLKLEALEALPDPIFILTESGRYAAIIGGPDRALYHDGSCLVDFALDDVLPAAKAAWFLAEIRATLAADALRIVEYTLSARDVSGVDENDGPAGDIWFEGRIQPMQSRVNGERAVLWLASNISRRHALEARLRTLSETDELTGLCNRRRFMHDMNQRLATYVPGQTGLALMIIDIDHFKPINDRYGHLDGDRIIRALIATCRTEVAVDDLFARLGGEEFVLVLPYAEPDAVFAKAERLRHAVAEQEYRLDCGTRVPVTISIGVTIVQPARRRLADLMRDADCALYDAKSRGRNRTVMTATMDPAPGLPA